MASLQYVIDSLCSKLTVEQIYEVIKVRIKQGPVKNDEIILLIRSKDRSLDNDSARLLVQTACEELVQCGNIKVDGDRIYPKT
jgi:hypothetical protein